VVWQGRGRGFSLIQVASNNRQGLPVRSVLQSLDGTVLLRTDQLGTVELVEEGDRFGPAS
jgi:beta-lactamase superfamily II metal-dependent hydrolase